MKKKLFLTALLLVSAVAIILAQDCHTISTQWGYFTGTAEECGEFVAMMLSQQ